IDWTQPGWFVFLEVFRRVLWLGVLLVGLIVTTTRGMKQQSMDDRPAPWLMYGLLIGLGMFFVHNLMDFVLAEAGAMTLFAVVLGAAIGVRTPWTRPAKPRRGVAIAALVAGAGAWIVAVLALAIPVADAEQLARDGDAALRAQRPDLA